MGRIPCLKKGLQEIRSWPVISGHVEKSPCKLKEKSQVSLEEHKLRVKWKPVDCREFDGSKHIVEQAGKDER